MVCVARNWDAIALVLSEKVYEVVGEIGGLPASINQHSGDLVGTAHHLRFESM